MDVITELFGEGKDLTALQMSLRTVVIFAITLILIRISGRRSFGIKTPLDNIIVITLGAILSRAIVGVSPFIPVVVASLVMVCIHRMIGWIGVRKPGFKRMIEGKKILVFEKGNFIEEHLKRGLVCEEDVRLGIRKSALTDNLDKIEKAYIETNGEITVIKKEN
jgi:uncharacterized membrane protein YcaP (DUF421 family)